MGQLALLVLVAGLVSREVWKHWSEYRNLDITLRWRPELIALAILCVLLTYALQIESWRRVLAGWSQRLAFGRAAQIWWLANLGRYIPGKIWSVAGLVVLTQRAGVPVWLAGASTVALQAVSIATCIAMIASTVGVAVSPAALAVAGVVALAAVGVLTLDWPARVLSRWLGPKANLRPLPVRAVVLSALLAQLSWATYGAAFWFVARGTVPAEMFSFVQAAGIFALGYLLGFLAVFVPGGIGVREVVYVGLLTPALGAGGAIGVAIASRLLLTILEGAAGLAAIAVGQGRKEIVGGQSQT